MKTKLFVGNLNFDAGDDELRKLFEPYGAIESVTVVVDKRSGKSKGYGFVQMAETKDAAMALELSGREFMGRDIIVTEADSPGEGRSRRGRRPQSRQRGGNRPPRQRGPRRPRESKEEKPGLLKKIFGFFLPGKGDDKKRQSQGSAPRRPPRRRPRRNRQGSGSSSRPRSS